ncbi:MAG: hypothetical protein Q9187_005465 [Circinaria calcarea]
MFTALTPTLQALFYYPLKIVAAEWVNYIFVLGMSLREYELSISLTGDLIAELEKLNINFPKIRRIIRFVKNHRDSEKPSEDWDALGEDYEFIYTEVSEHGERLEAMVPLITLAAALIESRRSLTETANVTRLTILALIFIPFSYIASLFSMAEDFGPRGSLFWVYFATAIPLAVVVALFATMPVRAARKLQARFLDMKMFNFG